MSFCMIEALDSVYFSSTRSHRESCPLLSARNRAIVGTIPESGAFLLDNASKLPDFVRTKCSAPHSVRKLWRYEVSINSLDHAGSGGIVWGFWRMLRRGRFLACPGLTGEGDFLYKSCDFNERLTTPQAL